MTLEHWYHAYAGGDWTDAVTEHLTAIADVPFDHMYVGMVGTPEQRAECWEYINLLSPIKPLLRAEADEGAEQVTLQAMHDHLMVQDANVWYSHTKGSFDASEINIAWRRSMEHDLFGRWQEVRDLLAKGYDAVGPHQIHPPHGNGFFGGNYWAASGRHIRLQPPLCWDTRWNAENWIALREDANLYDLRPGWPGFGSFWVPE